MSKPKGVALVQAIRAGRAIAEYEVDYLGKSFWSPIRSGAQSVGGPVRGRVAIVTITRPDALNALSESLLSQFEAIVAEVETAGQ